MLRNSQAWKLFFGLIIDRIPANFGLTLGVVSNECTSQVQKSRITVLLDSVTERQKRNERNVHALFQKDQVRKIFEVKIQHPLLI